MRETHKDLEIGGEQFRIGRINPLDGAWIVQIMLSRLVPLYMRFDMERQGFKQDGVSEIMSPSEARELQRMALSACRYRLENAERETWMPVISGETIQHDGVANQLGLSVALTVHSLMFNVVTPFFGENGLIQTLPKAIAEAGYSS